jgi:hypothetical protein
MDKMIRGIEKGVKKDYKKEEGKLKKLEGADKKRDAIVALGKKAKKKGMK